MHLFFDLEGTLTDPNAGITACIQYALAKLGHEPPPDEALVKYIGPPLHDSFVELLGSQRAAARAVTYYRERFASTGLYENHLYPGIESALTTLSSRCEKMYVVTSKPTVYARKIVAHFELRGFFSAAYGSKRDGTRADKTDLIGLVLREGKIPAHPAAMIGDCRHDVIGALDNGVLAIGVLWVYGSAQELMESGAHSLCAGRICWMSALPSTIEYLAVHKKE
ncbi:MAG: HAD hydrolase-like protein [Gammaproteobacteria bacterium]|nr:HAD hydrolase-like protein [Gammaproteobacteria bacterium]